MPINYSVKFSVSEYKNSNYLGYSYVNINGKEFEILANAQGKFILWNVLIQSVFMWLERVKLL